MNTENKKYFQSFCRDMCEGLPWPILEKMVENQVLQGNAKNPEIFCADICAAKLDGGFDWDITKEGEVFWYNILIHGQLHKFFELYPTDEILFEISINTIAERYGVPAKNIKIIYD